MPKLQSIANNSPNLKLWLYPPLEYPVLYCNIDQNLKGLVLWFPKGLCWNFLDICNQWTQTNQEMQRAFWNFSIGDFEPP